MKYAKAIAAAVGLVITELSRIFADDVFEWSETGVIVSVLVTAVASVYAVYQVENTK